MKWSQYWHVQGPGKWSTVAFRFLELYTSSHLVSCVFLINEVWWDVIILRLKMFPEVTTFELHQDDHAQWPLVPGPQLCSDTNTTDTRCTYSQCVPRAQLNNLWTDMWALVLVGVAHAFGTVGHVQQSVNSVRRMAKCTLKEFVRGSEWSNMVIRFFCFANHCSSLVLLDLTTDFTG